MSESVAAGAKKETGNFFVHPGIKTGYDGLKANDHNFLPILENVDSTVLEKIYDLCLLGITVFDANYYPENSKQIPAATLLLHILASLSRVGGSGYDDRVYNFHRVLLVDLHSVDVETFDPDKTIFDEDSIKINFNFSGPWCGDRPSRFITRAYQIEDTIKLFLEEHPGTQIRVASKCPLNTLYLILALKPIGTNDSGETVYSLKIYPINAAKP